MKNFIRRVRVAYHRDRVLGIGKRLMKARDNYATAYSAEDADYHFHRMEDHERHIKRHLDAIMLLNKEL